MPKGNWILTVLFLVFFSVSCSKDTVDLSNLYIPTPSDVTAKATLDELTQGRDLYVNSCGRCHQLYSPESFSASRWSSIVDNMARNTSLSSSEISLVKKYVSKGN